MNFGRILILGLLIAILGWGMYDLVQRKLALEGDLNSLNASLIGLKDENKNLTSRLEYFSHSENLLKELKSKFNYRETGEKLIIIIPEKKTTSTNVN